MRKKQLSPGAKLQLWQALFKGKLWYQLTVLSVHSELVQKWMTGFLYRGIKALLSLKGQPGTNTVFEYAFGCSSGEFMKL